MEQLNLRAKYEAQYARARGNLLAMLLLTLVNVVLMIAEAEVSFLFSAILPQVAINYGWYLDAWLGGSTYTWIAYAISVLTVALFALCYFLSKKHKGWMTAALVLFSLDCLVLVYWVYLGFMVEDIMDIAFHVWILYYLISGVAAAAKLKRLAPLPAGGAPVPPAPGMYMTNTPVPPAPQQPVEQPQQPEEQIEQPQHPVEQPQQSTEPERQPDFGPQPPMGPQSMDGEA